MICERRTNAKASAKGVFVDQERKLGDRRRSDTAVVLTVNRADQRLGDVAWKTPPVACEKSQVFGFRGEYGRKAGT